MTIKIFRGKDCVHHDVSGEHPEHPDRLYAIDDQLLSSGLDMVCQHADAKPVKRENLALAHDPYYIDSIFQRAPKTGVIWLEQDTGMTPITLSAALYAAGAGCDAVDWVMEGSNRQAFCAVRPPGHHAEYDNAMGFCLFNNIAVAARYAIKKYDLSRVAIVDFDVHHGNGTEHIIGGDRRIMMCSSFQHPFYPHSGSPVSASNILCAPLEAGSNSEAFRKAVSYWFDALINYKPQLILISAGFD
ncbi:histone deacetylase family protein, partial [Alteromonas sp. AMM-1]|uniref:histone deacetylase family protein n=1 Tax=Alteromonas sp. AMM-1 TaxID=3394233 RepID=UPI0039A67976